MGQPYSGHRKGEEKWIKEKQVNENTYSKTNSNTLFEIGDVIYFNEKEIVFGVGVQKNYLKKWFLCRTKECETYILTERI